MSNSKGLLQQNSEGVLWNKHSTTRWYQLLFGHLTAKGLQQQEEEQQQHLQSCSCSTAVCAAEVLELNMTYC